MYIDGEKGNYLAILHEFTFKDPEFTSYEHRLTNNELFVKCIDIDNKVLYIFNFPKEYMDEYELFKEGKYSKFGDDVKQLILKFWTETFKGNSGAVSFLVNVKQILYRETKLKQSIETKLGIELSDEQELGEITDKESETFKISEYSEK